MPTRTVTGTVLRADSSPWSGAPVHFVMAGDTFLLDPDATYPEDSVSTTTDADGEFSVALTSGLSVFWRCVLPGSEGFQFAVPDGEATTIESLRAEYTGVPQAITVSSGLIRVFNAKDPAYGALGDGTTDDRAAIQAAIAAAALVKGVVYLPPGTYLVGTTGTAGLLVAAGAVAIAGAGRDATTLRLQDGANTSVLDIRTAAGPCVVRDLTIDGNKANNPSGGHGIRIAGIGHLIDTVLVRDANGYGIGVGQESGSTVQDLTIRNVRVQGAGNDGIDFKNKLNTNRNNSLVGVVVDGFDALAAGNKAGIDVRGPCKLTNIEVRGAGSVNGAHVRFREGDGAADAGGHGSSLSDFLVVGADGVDTYGVYVAARDVHLANGQIEDVGIGLSTIAERTQATNVTARSCITRGLYPSLPGTALYATFVNCAAIACGADGIRVNAAACSFVGCASRDNGAWGIRLLAGADDAIFLDCDLGNNASGGLTDAASGTRRWFCRGLDDTQHLRDDLLRIQDNADATKQLALEVSGITTGTTRTLTAPNFDGTIATLAGTETLTNKTLTDPTVNVRDSALRVQDNADATKQAAFEVGGITTGTTRTYTLPNASGEVVLRTNAVSILNKTLEDSTTKFFDNADATKLLQFQCSGIATATTRTLTAPDSDGTIAAVLSNSAALDFGSIAAQTCAALTITVTGAATGDDVQLGPPAALENGLSATGIVTAADTVTVRLCNVTAGAIDPASNAWRATVRKR